MGVEEAFSVMYTKVQSFRAFLSMFVYKYNALLKVANLSVYFPR